MTGPRPQDHPVLGVPWRGTVPRLRQQDLSGTLITWNFTFPNSEFMKMFTIRYQKHKFVNVQRAKIQHVNQISIFLLLQLGPPDRTRKVRVRLGHQELAGTQLGRYGHFFFDCAQTFFSSNITFEIILKLNCTYRDNHWSFNQNIIKTLWQTKNSSTRALRW